MRIRATGWILIGAVALFCCAAAAPQDPEAEQADALNVQGAHLIAACKAAAAVKDFKEAALFEPDDALYPHNLARAYSSLLRYGSALQYDEQAVRMSNFDPGYTANFAQSIYRVESNGGRVDAGAWALAEQAENGCGSRARSSDRRERLDGLLCAGFLHAARKDYGDAIADLLRWKTAMPSGAWMDTVLGDLYYKAGDYEKAAIWYGNLLSEAKDYLRDHRNLCKNELDPDIRRAKRRLAQLEGKG